MAFSLKSAKNALTPVQKTMTQMNCHFHTIFDTLFQSITQNFEDISVHHNKPKPKCAVCSKTIAKNHRKILCEICNCQVHIKCNLTDVTSYNKIIRDKLPQKCINCEPTKPTPKPECCMCHKKIADNHRKLECNTCQSFIHIKCNKTDPKHYEKIIKDTGNPKIDQCNSCLVDNIPFQNLSELEFTAVCKGIDIEADVLNDTFITSSNLKSFFNTINKTNNPFEIDTSSLSDDSEDTVLINCKYYDLTTFNFRKDVKKISLFHTNIGSLEKHKEELETTLDILNYKFDIIALTETKIMKNHKPKFNINMKGYKTYFMPTEAEKGGTLIYISEDIKSKRRLDLESLLYQSEKLESTFIEITNPDKKNIIVGCIYRHPSMDLADFNNEFLGPLLQKLDKEEKRKYFLGDFNVDLLKIDNDSNSSSYFDSLTSHLFVPHIIHPTRITSTTKTIIDNIFSNAPNYQEGISGNLTTRLSDHLAQFLIIPDQCNHTPAKNHVYIYDIKNFDTEKFLEEIRELPFPNYKAHHWTDPNHAFAVFYTKIQDIINRYLKRRKITPKELKNKQKPWITKEVIKKIKKRDKLHKKYIKKLNMDKGSEEETEDIRSQYKTLRNQILSIIRSDKKQWYKEFFSQNSDNLRKTWRGIKTIINIKNKESLSASLLIDDEVSSDPKAVANEFNSYFSTVAEKLQKSIQVRDQNFHEYLPPETESSIYIQPSSGNEVIETINNYIINKKATGPNSIPAFILQLITPSIAEPLSDIINISFSQGKYIDFLKISRIIAIYKEKGDNLMAKNYRPISLLPNINKIFEKIMHKRVYEFVEDKNILYELQFGFRMFHSTQHALIDITEDIRSAIDGNMFALGVFIDLQKAFDTVDHEILLTKLAHYGIRGVANDWFRSYLSNRKQFVRIEDANSETASTNIGVPQGSVLGPLLFLLYINDLHFSIKHSKTRYFADDTCLLMVNKSLKQIKKHMNQDLKHLYNWLIANKISLNKDKTEVVLFRHPNKRINYNLKLKLNGKNLELTDSVKYLGVHLDSHLNWSKHIDVLAPKLNRAAGMLAKIRHYVSNDTLRSIYYSIFHSVLTYGAQIWGQTANKNINRVILIQKKALRIINFADFNSPTSKLFHDSKILKFRDHVTIQNFLLAHDFINHNLPPPLIHLIEKTQIEDVMPHPVATRAATIAKTTPIPPTTILKLPKVRTITGLNSITYKSCATWNYLSNQYFPKKDENHKSPCTIGKHLVKASLKKFLTEQYDHDNNTNNSNISNNDINNNNINNNNDINMNNINNTIDNNINH